MDGRKWRSNKSGRVGRNLTEKMSKYGSPVICYCLFKSIFELFIPPSIINFNFVMIYLTFKVLILCKNEETYIRTKAIRTYKKFLPLLLKDQFYNLYWIFIPSILLHLMQELRFSQ
jgi:hypothetical protein